MSSLLLDGDFSGEEDSSEEDEPISVDQQKDFVIPKKIQKKITPEQQKTVSQLYEKILPPNLDLLEAKLVSSEWLNLMEEVKKIPILNARQYYQEFLRLFPFAGNWWKIFAEHELKNQNFTEVQEILNKCLMEIGLPIVELWQFYLDFTRITKVDVLTEKTETEKTDLIIQKAHHLMCEAYELALNRVGPSIQSNVIWQGYIAFMKEKKDTHAFLEVRKLYHRALLVPMHNMDLLWNEYDMFEKSILNNEVLGQNMLKLYRPKFEASRAIYRDRKEICDQIDWNCLATVSTVDYLDNQLIAWQRYIDFELANPERLESKKLRSNRVRFVFEYCLCYLHIYPEIWYQYAMYEADLQLNEPNSVKLDSSNAVLVFNRALNTLPKSAVLHFALADFFEINNDIKGAIDSYERLLKAQPSDIAYITYQRFARRAKGADAARTIFKRARKDKEVNSSAIYTASALLEYYSDASDAGKTIALNIFELGLKKFVQETSYVLSYLDFLASLNDDTNMRSVLEKVLHVMKKTKKSVGRIWDRYLQFEYFMTSNGGGNLSNLVRLENRISQWQQELIESEQEEESEKAEDYNDDILFPMQRQSRDRYLIKRKNDLTQVYYRYQFRSKCRSRTPPEDQHFYDLYFNPYYHSRSLSLKNSVLAGTKKHPHCSELLLPEFMQSFASMLPLGSPWNGPIADVEAICQAIRCIQFPPKEEINKLQTIRAVGSDDENGPGSIGGGNSAVLSQRPAVDIFRNRQKQKLASAAAARS